MERSCNFRGFGEITDPYDTVITTTTNAAYYSSPASVAALAAAAVAAVRAAEQAAVSGASQTAIANVARAAAQREWANVTGGVVGYQENEQGILNTAVENWGSWASLAGSVASNAGQAALTAAVPGALGFALGSGTVLLVGGAVLLLLLLKR